MTPRAVLLVDPEEADSAILSAILEGLGYRVIAVADPAAALPSLKNADVAAILTSYPFPDAAGDDFAATARRLAPDIPIIGVIRRGMREVARDAMTNCCDEFLSKPVDAELLGRKLRQLVGSPESPPNGQPMAGP